MPQVVQTKGKPMWLLYEHLLLGQDVQRDEHGCWTVANSMRLSSTRERAQALQRQGDICMVTCDLLFLALSWPFSSILNVMLPCCQIPVCKELVDLCKMNPPVLSLQIWRKCLNSTSQNLQLSDALLPSSKPCNAQLSITPQNSHPGQLQHSPLAILSTLNWNTMKNSNYLEVNHVCLMWPGVLADATAAPGGLSPTLPVRLEAQILPWCKPPRQPRCRLCFPTV